MRLCCLCIFKYTYKGDKLQHPFEIANNVQTTYMTLHACYFVRIYTLKHEIARTCALLLTTLAQHTIYRLSRFSTIFRPAKRRIFRDFPDEFEKLFEWMVITNWHFNWHWTLVLQHGKVTSLISYLSLLESKETSTIICIFHFK